MLQDSLKRRSTDLSFKSQLLESDKYVVTLYNERNKIRNRKNRRRYGETKGWKDSSIRGDFDKGYYELLLQSRKSSVTLTKSDSLSGIHYSDYKVPVLNLQRNSRFNGHRILHLSDVHCEENNDQSMKRLRIIARHIKHFKIDTVVITGDLADKKDTDISPLVVEVLTAISKQVKNCIFVPGNHDYDAGITRVIKKVEQSGFTVLVNKALILGKDKDVINFYGFDCVYEENERDKMFFRRKMKFKGLFDSDKPTIALAHSLDSLHSHTKPCFDLVLSGHTHGIIYKFLMAELFLKLHPKKGTQKLSPLLYGHNRQYQGIEALTPRTISFVSNGLTNRHRQGVVPKHPFIQHAGFDILELRSFD